MYKNLLLLTIILLPFSLYAQSNKDTLLLFYSIDAYAINNAQKERISNYLKGKDSIISIKIVAYADYLASDTYNQKLTKLRAHEVEKQLTNYSKNQITSLAKGQILDKNPKERIGNSQNRRVELFIESRTSSPRYEKGNIIIIDSIFTDRKISEQLKILEKGSKFIIDDLNFFGNQHFLIPSSEPRLKDLFIALRNNPTVHIEIQGHVCCLDEDEDGYDNYSGRNDLSVERARYIYYYLLDKGINQKRLSFSGFGASNKLYPKEENDFQRQRNRRVEFLITKK